MSRCNICYHFRCCGREFEADARGTRAPADLERPREHLNRDREESKYVRAERQGERRPLMRPPKDHVDRHSDRRGKRQCRDQPASRSHAVFDSDIGGRYSAGCLLSHGTRRLRRFSQVPPRWSLSCPHQRIRKPIGVSFSRTLRPLRPWWRVPPALFRSARQRWRAPHRERCGARRSTTVGRDALPRRSIAP